MPKVSVNLPVYNGAASIRRQLDSIVAQTWTDYQVLITDNCSTDETETICREYAERDSRFHYQRNHKNMGAQFSYKRAFFQSLNSDYMVYASHSDYWDPEYLAECVQALDTDPKAVVAYSHCTFFDEKSGQPLSVYKDAFSVTSDNPLERYLTILSQLGMCTPYYGLIRMSTYADIESAMNMPSAALDNLLLSVLALKGKFIQVERPLFFREQPTYGQESYSERYDRILDMAGGDSRQPEFFGTLVFCAHLMSQCTALGLGGLEMADREKAIGITISTLLQRYNEHLESEINRSIKCLTGGRPYTGFGQEDMEGSLKQGQYKNYDYTSFLGALMLYEVAYSFFPDLPGINHAMALIHVVLGRHQEARLYLTKEVDKNPTNKGALELLAQYKKRDNP